MLVGSKINDTSVAGLIVSIADFTPEPLPAVTTASVSVVTPDVTIVKLALVAPAATITVGGTVALGLFEERLSVKPLQGAAALSVRVPVAGTPPSKEAGDIERLWIWF
jgi:hypothetical protein